MIRSNRLLDWFCLLICPVMVRRKELDDVRTPLRNLRVVFNADDVVNEFHVD